MNLLKLLEQFFDIQEKTIIEYRRVMHKSNNTFNVSSLKKEKDDKLENYSFLILS